MDDLVRRLHEQIERHANRGRSRQGRVAGNGWSWRQAQEDRGRQLNAYAAEAAPMCADDLATDHGLTDHQEGEA